jgi:hypothetical protein
MKSRLRFLRWFGPSYSPSCWSQRWPYSRLSLFASGITTGRAKRLPAIPIFASARQGARLHTTHYRRSASLIGHSGSSAFRLSTTTVSTSLTGSCFSSESAPGALPSWVSKTRWNNLSGDLAVNVTAGSSGRTNSPHPSSREGHHSTARWSSSVLLLD